MLILFSFSLSGAARELKFENISAAQGLSQCTVQCIFQDSKGFLWFGTSDGLNKYDGNKFTVYSPVPGAPGSLSYKIARTICEDQSGMLWVGTWGGGLNKFDRIKKKFTCYQYQRNNPSSLSHNIVHSIYEDRSGILWIGTLSGLNKFHRQKEIFTRYIIEPNNPERFRHNYVMVILEDHLDELWIGTGGNGLLEFDREKETFTCYTMKDGLPNNMIYGILPDDQGNLWLSTNKGISRFNPSNRTFKNYELRDGIQGYEFNQGAYHKNRNGEMFFGGVKGFNVFHPDKIHENQYIPPIVITDFKIANKPILNTESSPLEKHISETKEIVLSYKDNIFSFEFAALDYINPAKNQYMYMMEGFNDQWIPLGTKHDITFTNLDPGEYTLRVKGSNNDGIWNNEGTSIKIIIKPPVWRTWWFRGLLVLIISALAFLWHKSRMKQLTLKLKTEAEMGRTFSKYNISQRERQIILLILKGKTNKDIENKLFISLKTVKSHIYNIYQKLGVKNRLELIHLIQKSIGY